MKRLLQGGVALSFAIAGMASAVAGPVSFPVTFPAFSHPNGDASANPLAEDNRDYGLRLDYNGRVNTFHFVNVTMTFYNPPSPDNSTVMARLEGDVAHLQSSNGGTIGYAGSSGYDAEDQLYSLVAEFRVIGASGGWNTNGVPYAGMFDDLRAATPENDRLTFALQDTTLSPQFNPGDAVFNGPLSWDEYPGSDAAPDAGSFYITPRHRLTNAAFSGSEWDVLGAAGWLERSSDAGRPATNDFLFYLGATPVPEPASAALLSVLALFATRRR
ncbi:MAG: hypothetical protein KDA32_05130 [Phycisphaerales bacterium]|nr:hypothetical protein [Phycisphaerales bacterium]